MPSMTVRFPASDFYVYRYNSTLDPLITALLNSFDTRNRIIEVDNQPAPNTTEIVNATQRVDDATVAIRASINNLANELVRGTGMFNQAGFETASGLVWTTTPAT